MRVATRGPHLVVLTEVDVDDRADGRRMTKWCNATGGFLTPRLLVKPEVTYSAVTDSARTVLNPKLPRIMSRKAMSSIAARAPRVATASSPTM